LRDTVYKLATTPVHAAIEAAVATSRIRPLTVAPVLRDQVQETLEALIIDGTLRPGQRLLEAELAEQLHVSRNPVREALSLLARDGWIDLRPRHGAQVHEPSRKEVEDFFRVRTVLEGESARCAAEKATPGDLDGLRELVDRGVAAVAADDEQATVQANSAFHARMTEVADNRVLDEMLGLLKKRLLWYFAPVARIRGQASWDEHAALLDAIAGHDGDRAAAVMRDHCEATAALYRAMPLRGTERGDDAEAG